MSKDSTSDVNKVVGIEREPACLQTHPSYLGANREERRWKRRK
jgi:hypothetical protein